MAVSQEEWYGDWLERGNYLAALRVLEGQRWENESMRLQELSWLYGAVGRYRDVQRVFNEAMGRPWPPSLLSQGELDAIGKVPLEPAEALVLRAVEMHPVVILNEMHHQVEHRAFAARLMPRLKELGVKTVAWETPRQSRLDEAMGTGQVRLRTTGYSFEPQHAELLRAALRAGMKLVAIDFMSREDAEAQRREPERGGAIREAAMARNIDELILQRNPVEKLFVWVGGDHGCKYPWFGVERMGLCLWRRMGIEPFSIYQFSDSGAMGNDDSLYRMLVKFRGGAAQEPRAVRLPSDGYGRLAESLKTHPIYSHMVARGIDAAVLHPPAPFETETERPAWLQTGESAEVVGLVLQDDAPTGGCLVQALHEAEGEESTPADQVTTDPWGRYQLRVRSGVYRLRVWTPGARAAEEQAFSALPSVELEAGQVARRVVRLPGTAESR
jgi:hypothetical protein